MKRREKALAEKVAHARVTAAELAQWRAKAQAAGVTLSELLRQAMRRTRAWTAAAADIERARVREIARLRNISLGNAGDARTGGTGLFEMRVHHGPGYRLILPPLRTRPPRRCPRAGGPHPS